MQLVDRYKSLQQNQQLLDAHFGAGSTATQLNAIRQDPRFGPAIAADFLNDKLSQYQQALDAANPVLLAANAVNSKSSNGARAAALLDPNVQTLKTLASQIVPTVSQLTGGPASPGFLDPDNNTKAGIQQQINVLRRQSQVAQGYNAPTNTPVSSAKKITIPSFSNKAEFQSWYGSLDPNTQQQVKSQLGGK